jgi:hypothetical protein
MLQNALFVYIPRCYHSGKCHVECTKILLPGRQTIDFECPNPTLSFGAVESFGGISEPPSGLFCAYIRAEAEI